MAAPLFDFATARESFSDATKASLQSKEDDLNVKKIEQIFSQQPGSDTEKKLALDQSLRDVLMNSIETHGSSQEFLGVITLAANAVQLELCSPATLFILLQDVFDCFSLEKCEEVFTFLEDRVSMWKSEIYYNAGKNYLLRMCNDLLRRLSRSKNTVFCGRIQLFLARLFPLSEKSGLNIMSQFNTDNVTIFNTKAEEYDPVRKQSVDERDESMEFEEGETEDSPSNIPIDYNLYRKFWSLQDYFRKPIQCYDKAAWKTFIANSEDVLNCFESFKLEDTKSQKKKKKDKKQVDAACLPATSTSQPHDSVYFAKYLTSEKLLDLQLSDSNFRRYVLVQFLIMFQYLNAPVRFKSSSHVLLDEQSAWIKQTSERILKTVTETHPDGDKFSTTIEHILSREENWNTWKNDNCPSFIRDKETPRATTSSGAKKRSIGDDLKSSGGKLRKMGNSELTRLWNLCPDNVQACRTERNFLPSLEEFFEEAIEQMDPEAMIEDEYKLIKNPTYAWKSLRLLSRRSANFFSQAPNASATQKKKSVPEYLEAMLAKLAKEMPSSQAEDLKADVDDSVEPESADSAMQEEDQLGENKQEEETNSPTTDESVLTVKKDQLESLATKLVDDWKKLAGELGFPEDDIAYFEGETDVKEDQAKKMLTIWMENEGEKATIEVMRNALKEIGQEVVSVDVFGEKEESG